MFGIDQQVQQRIDAYRGNPQKLQQQYAQKKDIFDLIALNRITEEQESAANQMRLDAAKKGTLPSIYAQKESQALDNAKKEVIDEQAGVMQNKMKQMQDAQKKVLQAAGAPQMPGQSTPQPQQPPSAGLAGLPAPNIQGMAGGGIVAFEGGGSTDKETKEEKERRETAESDRARLKEFGASTLDTFSMIPRSLNTGVNLGIRGLNAIPGVSLPYFDAIGGPGGTGFFPRLNAQTRENAANQAINASRRLPADEATPAYAAAVARQAEARDQAQPPAPPPQAAPQGTGGGAPMGNAPGTVGFGIQSLIGTKTPDEAARENEARAAAAANYNPVERAAKERMIQERSAEDRDAEFINGLIGMSGYTTNAGALAAGAAARQRTRNQALAARHRAEGELIDIGPESRKAGTKAGEARYKDVVLGMSQGVDAAVKQAQVASSAADRQLARENLTADKAKTAYTGVQAQITRESTRLDRIHKDAVAELAIRGLKPNEYKIALAEINAVRDLGYQQVQNQFAPLMQKLESDIGIPSAGGFSLVGVRPNTPPK